MPLKSETVDAIFARMLVRYGNTWLAKWEGVPLDAVKADWASELHGISRDAIVYALGFLPLEFPPTVAQFRVICGRAPERQVPALPAPDRDPVKAQQLAVEAKAKVGRCYPSRNWAHALKAADAEGAKLTITQRTMYRAALEGFA